MILTVKATHLETTPRILAQINKICAKLEKLAPTADPDELAVKIEIGRITEHHRKGIVYRAEINVTMKKVNLRAKAAADDIASALDEAQKEIEQQLLKTKKRAVSTRHREGVRMKRDAAVQ